MSEKAEMVEIIKVILWLKLRLKKKPYTAIKLKNTVIKYLIPQIEHKKDHIRLNVKMLL